MHCKAEIILIFRLVIQSNKRDDHATWYSIKILTRIDKQQFVQSADLASAKESVDGSLATIKEDLESEYYP